VSINYCPNCVPFLLTIHSEKIHREKYRFKAREGFSLDNLRLPKRIFETPSPIGQLSEEFILGAVEYAKKVLSEK